MEDDEEEEEDNEDEEELVVAVRGRRRVLDRESTKHRRVLPIVDAEAARFSAVAAAAALA